MRIVKVYDNVEIRDFNNWDNLVYMGIGHYNDIMINIKECVLDGYFHFVKRGAQQLIEYLGKDKPE